MFFRQSPFQREPLSFKDFLKHYFKWSSRLTQLIAINIGVFVVILLLKAIFGLIGFLFEIPGLSGFVSQHIVHFFSCPASFSALLFRPWGIFTSLFMHESFWHIFFNMLMLYVIGSQFRLFLNNKQLLITYICGGIFGNLVYMVAYNLFPVFQPVVDSSVAIGASGSIMAIMALISIYRPNHRIRLILLGDVKLIWITLFFVLVDFLSIPKGNAGGHIAHLGGVIYGFFIAPAYYKKAHLFRKPKRKKKQRMKYATSRNYQPHSRPETDEEFNQRRAENEKKIDIILDKISKHGYDALSKEEKEFLFRQKK